MGTILFSGPYQALSNQKHPIKDYYDNKIAVR